MIKKQKWIREIESFTSIKDCIVLEGNIYDEYPIISDECNVCEEFCNLNSLLFKHYSKKGYKVCFYDLVNGFYNKYRQADIVDIFADFVDSMQESFGENIEESDSVFVSQYKSYVTNVQNNRKDGQISQNIATGFLESSDYIKHVMTTNIIPTVICINFASRILADPSRMIEMERGIFSNFLYAVMNSKGNLGDDRIARHNKLVLITDKVNDIPAWFYLNNPYVKTIVVPEPDKSVRNMYVDYNSDVLLSGSEGSKDIERFIELTDGMKILDMEGIFKLKQIEGVSFENISEIVSLYKYGIAENPWDDVDESRIDIAKLKSRVKGQDIAVEKSLEVIKRAKTGMSGLQHSSATKPRGILFFAGPTGTGKTELAKSLAELLFGDESACRRFDMSEYDESHSAQKLFGAPPGYVGYEAGGQLTNTMKEHPFSLLLFDEIEKASPTIWDKFLQILEDGRMTDGQGNTVYFSESIIVFTSNLGIYEERNGKKVQVVEIGMPYEKVCETVTNGIRNYFNEKGKPEVLNRIGKNLIVFDFINDKAAEDIMNHQIGRIKENLKLTKGYDIDVSDLTKEKLLKKVCANLSEGGRGVGNVLEEYFITPLSNYIFDNKPEYGCRFEVKDIDGIDKSEKVIIPKVIVEVY